MASRTRRLAIVPLLALVLALGLGLAGGNPPPDDPPPGVCAIVLQDRTCVPPEDGPVSL